MFLNGNFVALKPFQKAYGVYLGNDTWAIPTKWQSALFQAGQCGALVGVFMAGPITNRVGYRWTTIIGLILMNATIFVSFFVSKSESAGRMLISEGQFSCTSGCWSGTRRCSLGLFHRQCSSLCFRNCSSCLTWSYNGNSTNELVHWRNSCCCSNLWFQ